MTWLIASVHATSTFVVDGTEHTLASAYNAASNGDFLYISPSYDASTEPAMAIEKDLYIHSYAADTTAKVPPLAIVGCTVSLDDLEFVGTVSGDIYDSSGASYSCTDCSVILQGSTVVASDIVLNASGFSLTNSDLGLERLEAANLSGNLIEAEAAGATPRVLTINEATVGNSGPVVARGSGNIELTVTNSSFSDGNSTEYAGDIDVDDITQLTVKSSSFSRGQSGEAAGSIKAVSTPTTIDGSNFSNSQGYDGGAILLSQPEAVTLNIEITDVDITGSRSTNNGGAIYTEGNLQVALSQAHIMRTEANDGGTLVADGTYFVVNEVGIFGPSATEGAALLAQNGGGFIVTRGWFCHGDGSLVMLRGGGLSTFTNVVFQGERTVEVADTHWVTFMNTTLVGWTNAGLGGEAGTASVYNSILTGFEVGASLFTSDSAQSDAQYNLWWDNRDGDTVGSTLPTTSDDVFEDPSFTSAFELSSCTYPPRLSSDSPAVNAGDPSTVWNDADGSRNDIGAWGGPTGYDGLPWSRGADITVDLDDDTGVEPSDSGDETGAPDSSPDSDTGEDSRTDTDMPERPSRVTWVAGGCGASGAMVLLLGLALVRRR